MVNAKDVERNEKLLDAVLKVAIEEAVDHEIESYPSGEELNKMYPRSAAMDKRIMRIIDESTNKNKTKRPMTYLARIAASIAILLVVGIVALVSVEASRIAILNFFINVRDDHVVIDFGHAVTVPNNDNALFDLSPFGFEYVNSHHLVNISMIIFENAEGCQIILEYSRGVDTSVAVGNENREFVIHEIDGHELLTFESLSDEYRNIVIWIDGDDGVISITSLLDMETLLDIAASIISRVQ